MKRGLKGSKAASSENLPKNYVRKDYSGQPPKFDKATNIW